MNFEERTSALLGALSQRQFLEVLLYLYKYNPAVKENDVLVALGASADRRAQINDIIKMLQERDLIRYEPSTQTLDLSLEVRNFIDRLNISGSNKP